MQHLYRLIHANPRFHELERKRSRLSWTLASIVMANIVWYIIATAFFPKNAEATGLLADIARFWGQPVADGAATTWGIYIGLVQVVGFIGLVVFYINKANGELDALKDAVIADAMRAAGDQK
jgi:uncharacterized membrane protein (DUF485 family)